MNIPDHNSESLEIIFFGEKILQFFDADPDPGYGNLCDPGSGIQDLGWKNSDPGKTFLIRNTD
jgi:hypothetical protein